MLAKVLVVDDRNDWDIDIYGPDWNLISLDPDIIDPEQMAAACLGFDVGVPYRWFWNNGAEELDRSENVDIPMDEYFDSIGWDDIDYMYYYSDLARKY